MSTRADNTCADCQPVTSSEAGSTGPSGSSANAAARSDAVVEPFSMQPPDFDTHEYPRVVIEFCDRCRWLHRSIWVQTELFLTFPPTLLSVEGTQDVKKGLQAITLVPRSKPETGGRFRVWLYQEPTNDSSDSVPTLVWDRKTEGGFPELKVLKQRIRNLINPEQSLGHSDKKSSRETAQRQQIGTDTGTQADATPTTGPDPLDYTPRFRC
ncbi:hypothetical protein ACM66B_000952 [Microbotryomycetes sp. NB124-2]